MASIFRFLFRINKSEYGNILGSVEMYKSVFWQGWERKKHIIFGKCVKAMSFQLTIAEENSFLKNIFLLTDYLLTDQSSKSYSPTKTTQFLRLLRTYLTKKIPRKRILQCC